MTFKVGDKVRVRPLSDKVGRIIGGQTGARQGASQLYLVRYEVDSPVINKRSESSLYFEDELRLAP